MGERKVINKYYPGDFDPAKIGRRRGKEEQMKVRMMLPMSIRCKTCGNFTYKGTKFNSRKEQVMGETYLGIKIFRFYFRCGHCSAELCIKTDPKNADYTVECGATRNYETNTNSNSTSATTGAQDHEATTRRILAASKRAMDIDAALEELISLKSRQATLVDDTDGMLISYNNDQHQAADEALIKSIRFHPKQYNHDAPPPPLRKKMKKTTAQDQLCRRVNLAIAPSSTSLPPLVRVIKRRPPPPPASNNCNPIHEDQQQQHLNVSGGLELLFLRYTSASSSS